MIRIAAFDIEYYLELMRTKQYFSFAGYSDAEWYCMTGQRQGKLTALGQILDVNHGQLLTDILAKREGQDKFKIAIPGCLPELPSFSEGRADSHLHKYRIKITPYAYERDIVTDDLAREAKLYPLIKQLKTMKVHQIGPEPLRKIDFLNRDLFFEISTPNFHLEEGGIDKLIDGILSFRDDMRDSLILISAGVSAAVIIDRLHDELPTTFLFDCGSMWDAFVGIGGQREWRQLLYETPKLLKQWKRKNLQG